MKRLSCFILVFVAMLFLGADGKQSKATPPSTAQIQQWIKELGDDSYRVREEATRDLIKAGGVALDAVANARKSDDAEVKQRALRIIKQFKKNAEAYYDRGYSRFDKGEHDKAIADYSEAIRLNPNFTAAYLDRGMAWFRKGEYDKAITDFNETIRLHPIFGDTYFNRGYSWFRKGEYDRAIADYNEAIRLNPFEDYDYFVQRGKAWRKKGNETKAEADFQKAKELKEKQRKAKENHSQPPAASPPSH